MKNFANRMIADHTKTSAQLKVIIASKSSLRAPAAIDAEHQALLGRLRDASGAAFDRLYAHQQLEAQQQAVMLFTSESQSGKDFDFKDFAGQALPTLQRHLPMAQQVQKGGAAP